MRWYRWRFWRIAYQKGTGGTIIDERGLWRYVAMGFWVLVKRGSLAAHAALVRELDKEFDEYVATYTANAPVIDELVRIDREAPEGEWP